MQHSRANHQVERAANLIDALDRELMQFEILEIVLALKIARVAQARVADVDRRDSSIRLAKRVSFDGSNRTWRSGWATISSTWAYNARHDRCVDPTLVACEFVESKGPTLTISQHRSDDLVPDLWLHICEFIEDDPLKVWTTKRIRIISTVRSKSSSH